MELANTVELGVGGPSTGNRDNVVLSGGGDTGESDGVPFLFDIDDVFLVGMEGKHD